MYGSAEFNVCINKKTVIQLPNNFVSAIKMFMLIALTTFVCLSNT